MSRLVFCAILALAACTSSDASRTDPADAGDRQAWRVADGKPPSGVEYAAVVAACRDGAVGSARGKPLVACLADLGLRRAE